MIAKILARDLHFAAAMACVVLFAGYAPELVAHGDSLNGVSDDGKGIIVEQSLSQVFDPFALLSLPVETANFLERNGLVTRIEATVGNTVYADSMISEDLTHALFQPNDPPYDLQVISLLDGSAVSVHLDGMNVDPPTDFLSEQILSDDGRVVLVLVYRGEVDTEVWRYRLDTNELDLLPLPYAEISAMQASIFDIVMSADGGRIAFATYSFGALDDSDVWAAYLFANETNSTERIQFDLPEDLSAAGIEEGYYEVNDISADGKKLSLKLAALTNLSDSIPCFLTIDFDTGVTHADFLTQCDFHSGIGKLSGNGRFFGFTDELRNAVPGSLVLRVRDFELNNVVEIPLPELTVDEREIHSIAISNDGQLITFDTNQGGCGEGCFAAQERFFPKVWQHDRATGVTRRIVTNSPYPSLSER